MESCDTFIADEDTPQLFRWVLELYLFQAKLHSGQTKSDCQPGCRVNLNFCYKATLLVNITSEES